MQHTIEELQRKLQVRGTNLQTAVCSVAGKEEVNKAMAARAQVTLLSSTFMLFCSTKPYLATHKPPPCETACLTILVSIRLWTLMQQVCSHIGKAEVLLFCKDATLLGA